VVTAARYGEARVRAETEFSAAEIAPFGADSIQALLGQLEPFIDAGEEGPVLLINGKPAGLDASILSYPAEALDRLAILPPEAAAQYGHPSGSRVVNLVLKQQFSSVHGDAGRTWATRGGYHGIDLTAGQVAISGPARWNVQASVTSTSALRRSARSLAPRAGEPEHIGSEDPDDQETLLPSRRAMSFTLGVTRPLGDFSASLGLAANSSESDGERGQLFAGGRSLRDDNDTQMIDVSLTLSGRIAGWQTDLSARYGRTWSRSLLERGVDFPPFPALAGGDDPDSLGDGPALSGSRNRTRGENLGARLDISRSIVELPAGPLGASLSLNASRDRTSGWQSDFDHGAAVPLRMARTWADGQVTFTLPVSRRREGVVNGLGDLTVNLVLGGRTESRSPLQKRYGGGVAWSPGPILHLRASFDQMELVPTFEQLGGPVITSINRLYDYTRQEMAEPVWIIGGNPDLGRGRVQKLFVGAMVRPFRTQVLTLNVGYRRQTARGGVSGFPELTPAIEAAFQDRIVRDADGRLISVDARAINIARETSADLTSGIAVRWQSGGGAREGASVGTSSSPWFVTASLIHTWRLESELLTRPGVPPIDRLGPESGQARHTVAFQAVVGQRGLGATLNGTWTGPARLRGVAPVGDFRFKPSMIWTASLHMEPDAIFQPRGGPSWARGLRIALDVRNVFDAYRRVTLGGKKAPPGYDRDEMDPLGRTVRLSVRARL